MVRRADPFGPGLMYNVSQHATGSELFFLDDHDRRGFEWMILGTAERYELELIDYCLMSNHFHLFVLLRTPNLPAAVQHLMARYVARFNRRHDRRGHLVQSPYHAQPVLDEAHYLEVRRYFAMNPVKAGICRCPEDWPWSGYGGCGRVAPAPDVSVRRMVARAMEERRRPRAA